MGNTYEVNEWKRPDWGYDRYEWVGVYRGESLLKALYAMWRAKRGGSGCVKLEWRS